MYFSRSLCYFLKGYSIPPEDGLDADLPEFTGEFLDSWLVLLEKMVNPKTVLESPHTLPKTASKTTGGNYKPFDPLKYLTRTHRLAFQAVMKIWGKKPLKTYGARMSESVLTILCHILKGEKLIASEREKAQAEQSRYFLAYFCAKCMVLHNGTKRFASFTQAKTKNKL